MKSLAVRQAMNWIMQPPGRVIRTTQAETGSLLLHVGHSTPMLVIPTNYGSTRGDPHYLIISNDPNTHGMIMKDYFQEYVWDVSEIARLDLDLSSAEATVDRLRHGTIALGKEGELFIDPNTDGQREKFPLISLKSLDFANVDKKELVCFPRWRIVAGERESETKLFVWPQ